MSLSSEEIERYARQIVLRGVGGPGQNKLKAARVLVVGAGGLGSPALQYLAGAGVGTLGIVDDDDVALSNLHRQIIHGTEDVGRPKTTSATDAIRRLNPHVSVEPIRKGSTLRTSAGSSGLTTSSSTGPTISPHATRCPTPVTGERRPLVTAALGEFDGTLTLLKPYERDGNGRPNPTYRCLFPRPARARNDPDLRRGRRSRRGRRRARRADGARGHSRDRRRFWRWRRRASRAAL